MNKEDNRHDGVIVDVDEWIDRQAALDVRHDWEALKASCLPNLLENGSCPSGVREQCWETPLSLEDRDEKEDQEQSSLGEKEGHELETDVYSLMFVSPIGSKAFIFSLATFIFQMWILALITVDLLEDTDFFAQGNHFRVPLVKNTKTVIAAQYSALLIALMSQDDSLGTLGLLSVAYDGNILQWLPSATYRKWVVCNALRFVEGTMMIFVSFIFISQAQDVLNLFMNFAAVEFVSELDNLFFEIASHGYLGHGVGRYTAVVPQVKFDYHKNRRMLLRFQQIFFFVLLATLSGGLLYTQRHTAQGTYIFDSACQSLDIIFPEESFELPAPLDLNGTRRNTTLFANQTLTDFPPSLIYSYFSGDYRTGKQLINDRPVYYERGMEDEPTAGMFYYCDNDEAWVFTIPAMKNNVPTESVEDCGEFGWLMQSPVSSEASSLDKVTKTAWNVWTGAIIKVDLAWSCNRCARNADCGMVNGVCNKETRKCECTSDWGGHHCEIELPQCPELRWVEYGNSSNDFYSYPGKYYRDDSIMIGGRSVYVDKDVDFEVVTSGDGRPETWNMVAYIGTRWLDTFSDASRLEYFFFPRAGDELHAYWHLEQQDISYYTEQTREATPVKLSWYLKGLAASVGALEPYGNAHIVPAKYECVNNVGKRLIPTNYCGTSGTWNSTSGNCDCDAAYGGQFCEFTPASLLGYPGDTYTLDLVTEFMTAYENGTADVFENPTTITNWTYFNEKPYYHLYWERYGVDQLYCILSDLNYLELPHWCSEVGNHTANEEL